MAHHALDAADRDVFRVVAEDLLDCAGFVAVVFTRAGAVRVDVVNVTRRELRISDASRMAMTAPSPVGC